MEPKREVYIVIQMQIIGVIVDKLSILAHVKRRDKKINNVVVVWVFWEVGKMKS